MAALVDYDSSSSEEDEAKGGATGKQVRLEKLPSLDEALRAVGEQKTFASKFEGSKGSAGGVGAGEGPGIAYEELSEQLKAKAAEEEAALKLKADKEKDGKREAAEGKGTGAAPAVSATAATAPAGSGQPSNQLSGAKRPREGGSGKQKEREGEGEGEGHIGEKVTFKDRTKRQRLAGQSGIGEDFKTWRTDEEMALRQRYD